jgi:hypothetical protein
VVLVRLNRVLLLLIFIIIIIIIITVTGGLRHEPSSPARKLGSWVRISLEAWMFVCVRLFCVCVVLCVGRGLATGWSPVQGVLPTVYRIKELKKIDQAPTMGCRAVIIIIIAIIKFFPYCVMKFKVAPINCYCLSVTCCVDFVLVLCTCLFCLPFRLWLY